MSKIAIIGSGHVGSCAAFLLALTNVFQDIVLIDKRPARACAEADDMMTLLGRTESEARVRAGDYSDCAGADMVVITAAAPVKLGQTRNDMFAKNAAIVADVVRSAEAAGFAGLYLMVSNPVDVLTYYLVNKLGIDCGRVLGMGTLLDTMRLEDVLRDAFCVNNVCALTLGEHGEGLLVDWARTFVDNKIIPQSDREPLRRKAIDAAYSIMRGKGSTSYGIASAVVDVITAWKARDSKPRPLSFVLHGEFGIHEMALSVPVSFDVDSAPRVQSFEFDKELLGKLQETADSMKKFYKEAAETA